MSAALAILGFDYESFDHAVAVEARDLASRIRAFEGRVTEEARALGCALLGMKERVGHGNFGAWLAAEFRGGAERTAQRYMTLAEAFGPNPTPLTDLPLTAAYALAAKSTPPAVRTEIVGWIESGKPITPNDIIGHVRMARTEARGSRRRQHRMLSRKERQRRAADPQYAERQRRREEREDQRGREAAATREHAMVAALDLLRERLSAEDIERLTDLLEEADSWSALSRRLKGERASWSQTEVAEAVREAAAELTADPQGIAA